MTAAAWADLGARLGPVVVFLLAITVTAELAERAGVFDVAGHAMARLGRRRVWLLWLLFALLAAACTVVLSLDTTAVLLTPVGLAVARQVGVSPVPFALTTLWVANTGSLLLPVSNLTNLLALHRFAGLGLGHAGYVALAARPALVALVATLVLIVVLRRRDLAGRYAVEPPAAPHDRPLLRAMSGVCLALGPLFALGASPAVVAASAAAGSVVVVAARAPVLLRRLPVPWRMALGFVAVAAVVTWADTRGLGGWLTSVLPSGTGHGALLSIAAVGAVGANVGNNLPAYLALEPAVADAPARLMALLVGVNAGPLVTPWASLATLLWLGRCRAAGVRIPPARLAAYGLLCAALTVTAATLTL